MMGAGDFGGLFAKFLPVIGAVIVAFHILHKVVEQLAEGIKHGAEAYQRGARLGGPVGAHFQAEQAFKAIGMEGMDLQELQGQFNPRAKKFGVPDSEMILGAARAGQLGNVQQLTNMSEEFKKAMRDGAANARQMEAASKTSQMLSMEAASIGREWDTMWTQISTVLMPVIMNVFEQIKIPIQMLNYVLEAIIKVATKIHLIHPPSDFKQMGGSMGKSGPSFTSWEKMGFVFGNKATPEKHLQSISSNTAATVKAVNELARTIGMMAGLKAVGGMLGVTPLMNMP